MRKTYDRTFKLEIVRKIVASETTVSSVASEYNISRPIVSIVTEIKLSVVKELGYLTSPNNML